MKKIISLFISIAITFLTLTISVTYVFAEENPYNYSYEPIRAIYYVLPTMKGNDVKWVQCSLNMYGNYGLAIDGSFGPACKEATKKFQASMGIEQDGSFGPATRTKMVEWLNSQGIFSDSGKASSSNSSSNSDEASRLLEAAYGECNMTLGYKQQEFDNKTKYGAFLGADYMDWCAAFVAWCGNQAGISTNVIPRRSFVRNSTYPTMLDFYKEQGLYKDVNSYIPKAGDLAFYAKSVHIGIVISSIGNTVTTIEGNTSKPDFSGQSLYVSIKTHDMSAFIGFATPNYNASGNISAVSAPTLGFSIPSRAIYYTLPTMCGDDVKWVQSALNIYGDYSLEIDGSFGPACRAATKKFQASIGIDQDGSFGPVTRAKMIEWLKNKGY